MSEMQRNRGIIKRLSTAENARAVFDQLVKEEKIDPGFCEFDDNGVHYIEAEDYDVVNGAIFDISGAPDQYDDGEEINEAERLNETDYRIHAYYYNGGADIGEMLDDSIPKADKEYEEKEKANVFYAIKFKNGHYWSRGTNASPSTFSSMNKALGTANNANVKLDPDTYDIVRLVEQ